MKSSENSFETPKTVLRRPEDSFSSVPFMLDKTRKPQLETKKLTFLRKSLDCSYGFWENPEESSMLAKRFYKSRRGVNENEFEESRIVPNNRRALHKNKTRI